MYGRQFRHESILHQSHKCVISVVQAQLYQLFILGIYKHNDKKNTGVGAVYEINHNLKSDT